MYINTFKYTPKDVSCQLCTEYVKKLGCTALRCPWLAERIEAGVVGYREAVMETFPRDRRLSSRLNLLIKHYPGSLWSNEQHERRMQYQCAVQGYRRPGGRPFRYHHSAAEHDKRSLRFGHRAQDQGAAAAGHEGRQVHRCAYSLRLFESGGRLPPAYHRPYCRRCGAADVPLGFRGRWPQYHRRAAE